MGVRQSMPSCLNILVLQTYYILSENLEYSMTEDYGAKYRNNILVKEKGELPEEDQLHTENIQDFKLVENRILDYKGRKRQYHYFIL